jgi:hypothetical protein
MTGAGGQSSLPEGMGNKQTWGFDFPTIPPLFIY